MASNFKAVMIALSQEFERQSQHKLILSFASSGKHYTQIRHGAPFDAFFSADETRPKLLEQQGLSVSGLRFTYASGRLVLWSLKHKLADLKELALTQGQFRYLAVANPKHAPYGRAAKEVLSQLGLWKSLRQRLVLGENINQAYQFVHSGNAELGFVALSQMSDPVSPSAGDYWLLPQKYYSPIKQQAVLLKDSKTGRLFFQFMQSKDALKIIRKFGYDTRYD